MSASPARGIVSPEVEHFPVGVSVVDLRERWARYLVDERGLSPQTAWTYEQGVVRLEKWTGKPALGFGRIEAADVRSFFRDSDYSTSSKAVSLNGLKSLRRLAILEGQLTPGAIEALQPPRVVHARRRPLTDSEVRTVLDAVTRPKQIRLVYLALYGGLRVGEMATIGEQEWELPERLAFTGKGSKYREVPVHPELLRQRPVILGSNASRAALEGVCKGLSHYTGTVFNPHRLRHTFSCKLMRAKVRLEVRERLLGHSPRSITDAVYSDDTEFWWDEMVDAIGRLSY